MADIFGTTSNDFRSGTPATDVIRLDAGNDTGVGDAGDDSIYGDAGNDSLFGDTTDVGGYYATVGNDLLDGGDGFDLLRGGFGDDRLIGGADSDTLFGEVGADLFVIDASGTGPSTDRFEDFDPTEGDQIDLRLLGISEFSTIQALQSAVSGGTQLRVTFNGVSQTTLVLSDAALVASDLVFAADAADDNLFGTGNADDLIGGAGNDTLNGLGGNDQLFGELGNDTLFGGANTDTLFGGSDNDSLSGGDGTDSLSGGSGNDTLDGGTGADLLVGDEGADIFVIAGPDLVGGRDRIIDFDQSEGDRLDVQALGISEFATLQKLLATTSNGYGTDSLVISSSGYQSSSTSFYGADISSLSEADVLLSTIDEDDDIFGTADANALIGGLGNDIIRGYFGSDQIYGESGDDRLYAFNSGNQYTTDVETLDGGSGNDTLTGGAGNDTLRGGTGTDTLIGGDGADLLEGGDDNDSLSGGAGIDTLLGGAGDDLLAGGGNDDILTGGAGADQFFVGGREFQNNYATDFTEAEGDQINLTLVGISEFDTARALLSTFNGDAALNIRTNGGYNRLILTGIDLGTIDAADFIVSTTNTNDSIVGNGGGDDLFGGLGNDTLIGRSGFDRLFGEDGDDRLFGTDYSAGTYERDGNYLSGGGGFDEIIGGYGADTLLGGDGDDILNGAFEYSTNTDAGDTLIGGAGDDRLVGGSGGDTLTGGDGYDSFVLENFGSQGLPDPASNTGDIVTDFGPGDVLDVTRLGIAEFNTLRTLLASDSIDARLVMRFNGIESTATLLGVREITDDLANFVVFNEVGTYNDTDGTANADDLIAGRGNDTVRGNGGDDRIFGEQGNDILFGGDQSLLGGDGDDLLDGGSGDDQLNAGDGVNTLLGGAGDDTLVAGRGNDVLAGGEGADTLTGGEGFNTFIIDVAFDDGGAFDGAQTEIITDFELDRVNSGEGDTLDISRLGISEFATVQALLSDPSGAGYGAAHFEVLTNGNLQSVVFGNIYYSSDFRAADFGFNTDTDGRTLYGFFGDDHVFGGLGDDRLHGSEGGDTLFGEGGDDVLFGGTTRAGGLPEYGSDLLFGGSGNDYLQGDQGSDLLDGGTGNDTLRGGSQGDDLQGGEGDDTLIGGGDNDTIDGGAGSDTAVFSGNFAAFRIDRIDTLTVVADIDTTDGNEGADGITNVEFLQFDDTLVALGAVDVIAVGDTATVSEDGPAVSIDVTANDTGSGTLSLVSFTNPGIGQLTQTGNLITFDPLGDFQFLGAGQTQTVEINYTVTDGTNTDIGLLEIVVQGANDAPVTVLDSRIITEDIASVTLNVLANDTDVDGDVLTITAVTQPTQGSVAIVANQLVFTPGAGFQTLDTGEFSTQVFTYTVSDGTASTTQTVRVRVNGVNDAPVVGNDLRSVAENTATLALGVLANDTDIDGDTLTITAVTQPTLGSVAIVGNDLVFSTEGDFESLDTGERSQQVLTYTVSDGTVSRTATVRVNVLGVNDRPVAVSDITAITEDTANTIFDVLANDSDIDGDALTISAVTQPTLGSVAIVGNQVVFSNGTAFQFLGVGETSTQTFTYTVTDGTASVTQTARVVVNGANDVPVAADDTATLGEDTASVTLNVLANDTDVDGDTLTIAAITQPTVGSAAIVGNQVVFSTNGAFQGLDTGEQSVQTVTYTVSDGTTTDTAVATFVVTGINDAPVGVDDTITLNADQNIQFNVLANDTDVDGETLTVTAVTQPGLGSVAIVGGNVVFSTNGAFDGLATGATSVQTFTYTVTDGTVSDTATVTVTVFGVGGGVDLVDDTATVSENTASITVDVLANDTGAAGFAVTAVTQPDLGSAAVVDGRVVFSTNGAFEGLDTGETSVQTVTYTASNGTVSETATLTVTVTGANDRPDAVNDTATITEDVAPTTINVLANDIDVDGETLTVTAVTQPSLGSVSIVGGQVVFSTDGDFDSLDTGDAAVQTFTYTISDGTASDTASVTVTITGANDAPDAIDDTARLSENTATVSIDVTANDIDLDAENLTVTSFTQPALGAVTLVNGELVFATNRAFEDLAAGETSIQTFSYTVSDGTASDTATVTVTVVGANDRPTAVADVVRLSENAGATPIDVLANDFDIDGDALTLLSITDPTRGSVEIIGGQVVFTPSGAFDDLDTGEFVIETLSYTFTDGLARATGTLTVRINGFNDRPDTVDDTDTVDEDNVLLLNVLLNDSDVDGDALTITDLTQPTLGTVTLVELGGSIGVPAQTFVSFDPQGAFDFLAAGETSVQTFTYTVSDGTVSDTATVSVTVTGVNDAPVAIDDETSLGEDDFSVSLDVVLNDLDAEDDDLTLVDITQPTRGALTLVGNQVVFQTNGDFDFLRQGESVTEVLTYTVSDGADQATATLFVTIEGANDAPVAVDDTAQVTEDASITFNVVANDSDADGDLLDVIDVTAPNRGTVEIIDNEVEFIAAGAFDDLAVGETATEVLTYTVSDGVSTSTATLTVTITGVNDTPVAADDTVTTAFETPITIDVLANDSDIDGDDLTVSLLGNGSHGRVELVNNRLVYTPDSRFVGSDSFSYQISDGQGGSSIATVFVTVDPRDNIAPDALDDAVAVAEDGVRLINVLRNDEDEDDDTLTITAFGQGANGSVILVGTQLQYTPNADFNGTDSFAYTVDDGFGGSDTATVTVTVRPRNDAPTAVADFATVAEDRSVVIRVLDNDVDIDGDLVSLASVGQAINGTVEQVGRLIRYTPNANFNGTDSFVYTARDPSGTTSQTTVTVNVTPVNDAPVAGDDIVSVIGGDPTTLGVLENDIDIDGGTLVIASFTQGAHGQVSRDVGGDLVYRAIANFNGTDSFEYTITDGRGGRSTATVNVTIQEADPLLILGTDGRDRLIGTAGDDIFNALGGSGDQMLGLGGNDVFDFSSSIENGVREKKFVLDYEVGIDEIFLGGALPVNVQELADRVILFLDLDGDVLVIQGVTSVFDITFTD